MSVAISLGQSERVAVYEVPDNELAVGSTLGGPRAAVIIKANGALQKVYSSDMGQSLFGTLILRHYDEQTGMHLAAEQAGSFIIHPEHQEHRFAMAGGIAAHETVFVLSGQPGEDGSVDPPGVYLAVTLRNAGSETIRVATYAFVDLRGGTEHDVVCEYDKALHALVAWNKGNRDQVRIFGCSERPRSYEVTLDSAMAVSGHCPGPLSGTTDATNQPLGVLQHSHALKPGASAGFYYLLSFGAGREEAEENYRACPAADEALDRTRAYYHTVLRRAVVLTPNEHVNRGVLWAKANMLRVQTKAPTGWCFVNDPTRSNNSVGRDTAWYAFGADYMTPPFARESLLAYVRNQEKSGKVVEYYDIRSGKTEDYGLNINDNTPLLILALWHHYNTTGDERFLKDVYPAAAKAARYIVSQRNEQGLVWCTATGTADWGIIGWRNVIPGYRLSGASTEVNSECYAALKTIAHMARVLGRHDESAEFTQQTAALKDAINTHLLNPENGLYYLNIDLDGKPRSDVTSDLVFPVMFGVASEETSARIIGRLSGPEFWTTAGMRTTPRDAPSYTPDGGWGLLGGVWVGVSFWYAFAAAAYNPEFMDHALSTSFRNYSADPRRNNTVPGQFSEWLHGETLVNQGMMLSPWFPPRYLWAAIEGAAGLDLTDDQMSVRPRLAPDWKWLGVRDLPYRGRSLTWLAVRTPDVQLYTNFHMQAAGPYRAYEDDITDQVHARGEASSVLGLKNGTNLLLFVGSTATRTITTSLCVEGDLSGSYRLRLFESLLGRWMDRGLVPAERLKTGHVLQIERKGFCLLDLQQEV